MGGGGASLPAITGLVVTTVGTDFIDIQWDSPVVAVEFIRIQSQLSGGDWSTLLENYTTSGDQTAAELSTWISPNTSYDIRIRAEDGSEFSEWTYVTSYTLPAAPTVTSVGQGPSAGELILTWTGVSASNYKVYYNLSDDFSTATLYETGATSPKIVSGLDPGTMYYIYVTEFNTAGESSPGTGSGITTA